MIPEKAIQAPPQVAVASIPADTRGQQTFTAAEMLTRGQSVGSPAGTFVNGPATVEASSHLRQPGLAELAAEPMPFSSEPQANTFGRLFPGLPAFSSDNPSVRRALETMGMKGGLMDAGDDLSDPKTLLTDPSKSLNNPDNPQMTAGMTFLGQFLDHDITLDLTSRLGVSQDPTSVRNFRTPAFELDSVYGSGPQAAPYLYDQSDAGRGIKFLLEDIPGSASQSRGGITRYDVPRDSANVAVIGDSRNDENMIISQLQVAFLKFHNAVVDQVTQTTGLTNPSEIFAEAQRLVRWHYQWIIVHEFLPKTVGPELVQNVLTEGRQFYHWQDEPFIPVEFSISAYRFGHSSSPKLSCQLRPGARSRIFCLGVQ
jgi:hypothetical protein